MSINTEDIKRLRDETGAGVADIKQALDETGGNLDKAKDVLKQRGLDKAAKKSEREVRSGLVDVYSHGGRVGVIIELLCETDFVAKTEDFKNLAHELALQVASMDPENTEELINQEYIRDNSLTIKDLIASVVGRLGENIQVGKFARIELGK